MKTYNELMVKELFSRESVLLGSSNGVPVHRAVALFSKGAVEHAKALGCLNGYGAGGFTLMYLTYKGFQAAASFYNVQQLRKEAEDYEKEAQA